MSKRFDKIDCNYMICIMQMVCSSIQKEQLQEIKWKMHWVRPGIKLSLEIACRYDGYHSNDKDNEPNQRHDFVNRFQGQMVVTEGEDNFYQPVTGDGEQNQDRGLTWKSGQTSQELE